MEVLGSILMVAGIAIGAFGGIWLLVEAFKTSVWWGLGCLLFQIVSLFFVIAHFDVAKKPFLVSLAGTAIAVIGIILMPAASMAQ